ncbi:unnamed protein product [Caenorhabditis sp. 36 PRJEB53466]|nr:unnamed protein product [Caenorhabditis sp. 36 PRJEB53466]
MTWRLRPPGRGGVSPKVQEHQDELQEPQEPGHESSAGHEHLDPPSALGTSCTPSDAKFDDKVHKYEARQKKAEEERRERRALRRQNQSLGLHNNLLALENRQLNCEKQTLKAEKREVTEKKNEMARRLRKQKRISEYYRRRLIEIQQKEAAEQNDHSK